MGKKGRTRFKNRTARHDVGVIVNSGPRNVEIGYKILVRTKQVDSREKTYNRSFWRTSDDVEEVETGDVAEAKYEKIVNLPAKLLLTGQQTLCFPFSSL
jgi:hypothetical protein